MRKVKVVIGPGQVVEGELMDFISQTPDTWLEFMIPDDRRILRIKPVMIRIVKMGINDLGEPMYRFNLEHPSDIIPSEHEE